MSIKKFLSFVLTVIMMSLVACTKDDDSHQLNADKFDEPAEVVANRVVAATHTTDSLFQLCQSASELEQYAEQIRQMEGVEDVAFSTQGMTVKLKNFLPIHYIYPQYEDAETEISKLARETEDATQTLTRALENRQTHKSNNLQTLCIVDQLSHDEGFSYVPGLVNDLERKAKLLGMDVKVIRNEVMPNFFKYDMYDYDMLFILAHGDFYNNTHFVATGLPYGSQLTEQLVTEVYEEFRQNATGELDSRYFDVAAIEEKHTRNGRLVKETHYYLAVNENYIQAGGFSYPEERYGKAIVFSASCKALEGNDNMANTFLDKGAACYLGYNETQTLGVRGGHNFLVSMLCGLTIDEALSKMPTSLREEDRVRRDPVTNEIIRRWHASLGIRYNGRIDNAKNVCARCVQTHDAYTAEFENSEPNMFGEEEQGFNIIKGSARMLYPYENTYGFLFGKKEDLSDAEKLAEYQFDVFGHSEGKISYDNKSETVTFFYTFKDGTLFDGEEYYFCAYMKDEEGHYCYGEIKKMIATGLIKGELGLFELRGPVKSYTFRHGSDREETVRTFDRDGFWLTYNGQSIKSIYNEGITRDLQGRITEGFFEGGSETYEYDARGRVSKYGYLYYDGGYGLTYHYGTNGMLEMVVDTPWGMDAETYGTDVYYYKDYSFDSHGNWTRRVSYTAFSGAVENRRSIEYYDD